ncbi:MAG: hypothetical protein OHK0046_16970 [Anaerolineae bacterium]
MLENLWTEFRRLVDQVRTQGLWLALLSGVDKLTRIVTGGPAWRYSRISPRIILGGQPATRVLSRLMAAGVVGIINMRAEHDYAEQADLLDLKYIYLPTIDQSAPSLKDLWRGIAFIDESVKEGGSVYIHCWEGLGRGPTMAAAYFVSQGASPTEAWQKIRETRPFIRPTKEQMEQLIELEAQVKARATAPQEPQPEVDAVEVARVDDMPEEVVPEEAVTADGTQSPEMTLEAAPSEAAVGKRQTVLEDETPEGVSPEEQSFRANAVQDVPQSNPHESNS